MKGFQSSTSWAVKQKLAGGFNPSENISQIGSFPQVGVKIKNMWNHHLENIRFEEVTGRLWSFFGLIVQASQVLISIERHLRLGKSWGNFVKRRLGEKFSLAIANHWGSNIQGLRPIRDTAFSHCAANDRQHHGVQQLLRQKVKETDRWEEVECSGPNPPPWGSERAVPSQWTVDSLAERKPSLWKNWHLLVVTDFYKFIAHRSSETVQSLETYGHPTSSPSTGQTPSEDILVQLLEQGFYELNWCKKKRSTNLQVCDTKVKSSRVHFPVHFPVLVQISSKMCKNQISQPTNGDKTTPTK